MPPASYCLISISNAQTMPTNSISLMNAINFGETIAEVLYTGGTDLDADVDLAVDVLYALANLLFKNYNNIANIATLSSSECLATYITTSVPGVYTE
jgi:hypothetical protein